MGTTKLCECGCGQVITPKPFHKRLGVPFFITGHNRKWQFHTEETKSKMSNTMKRVGNLPEVRLKNSQSKVKYYQSVENLKNFKIRCNTIEHKAKLKAIYNDPKVKQKISESVKKLWKDIEYRNKVAIAQEKASNDPLTKKKRTEARKVNWQNPEFVKKQMKARSVKQNKQEKILESLLNELYPNEWKFVGDGEVVIAGKCPDFINVNGQKKVIELFGDFWHRGQNPQDRIDIFKQFGFDTLVIWEHELKDVGEVRTKISNFQSAEMIKT